MYLHKINFQVSLSDGWTFQEGKGLLEEIEGELSPWNKLIKYVEKKDLRIVSLVLVNVLNGQTFTLPSAGKNPNFQPFRELQKPIGYRVSRAISKEKLPFPDSTGVVKDWYTFGVAIYPEYELQLWVDELDPRNSWTLVVPLKGKK